MDPFELKSKEKMVLIVPIVLLIILAAGFIYEKTNTALSNLDTYPFDTK